MSAINFFPHLLFRKPKHKKVKYLLQRHTASIYFINKGNVFVQQSCIYLTYECILFFIFLICIKVICAYGI